jgi:RHS repeat-associated protein
LGGPVPAGQVQNPFGFTGQRMERLDNGQLVLYDYKARVYDPVLGRFLQRDPVEVADQYNLYEYVKGRPTVATDPTGKQLAMAIGVGIDIGIAAATTVAIFAAYQAASHLQYAVSTYAEQLEFQVRAAGLYMAAKIAQAERVLAFAAALSAADKKFGGMTVADIIRRFKIGTFTDVPLPPGGPDWKVILKMTWARLLPFFPSLCGGGKGV